MFQDGIGDVAANGQLTSEQQAHVKGFVKDNWYPLIYQLRHDAAVRHLLHIDQNLLELPVAKFYTDAFEKVWEQISDGKDMQLSLAKMTAEVPKRSLEKFMETGNE